MAEKGRIDDHDVIHTQGFGCKGMVVACYLVRVSRHILCFSVDCDIHADRQQRGSICCPARIRELG